MTSYYLSRPDQLNQFLRKQVIWSDEPYTEWARRLGVSPSTVRDIAMGKRRNSYGATQRRILKGLGLTQVVVTPDGKELWKS